MSSKRDPELNVTCPQCREQFYTTRQRLNHARATGLSFCGNPCAGKYKSERGLNRPPLRKTKPENTVIKPCGWCGKPVERKKYNTREVFGPFCNHACYGQWRSANLAGENSPAWKGGYELWYEGNWKSQRAKARKRDNHTCQDCGVTEQSWGYKLDVHHIVDYDDFEDKKEANDLNNLVTLCRTCHVKRHN